jgi:ankyrin repeat protein
MTKNLAEFWDFSPLLVPHLATGTTSLSPQTHPHSNSIESSPAPKYKSSSALHIAIKYANKEVITRLLEGGTSINSLDAHGQSPFHVAAMEGNAELVEFLFAECIRVNQKFNLNMQDLNGWTALHCAAYQASHIGRSSYLKICELFVQKVY